MSRIRANQITNQSADGAPTVQNGLVISGVTTSTTFSGSGASLTNIPSAQLTGALPALDGSNLTGITQTTINNNANNRIITGSGTANTLEGESTITYDNPTLEINTDTSPYAALNLNGNTGGLIQFEDNEVVKWSIFGDSALNFYDNPSSASRLYINNNGNIGLGGETSPIALLTVNKGSTGSNTTYTNGELIRLEGYDSTNSVHGIGFGRYNGGSNGYKPAAFIGAATGTWSSYTNCHLVFATRNTTGDDEPTERLRITNAGDILIGTQSTNSETGKLDIYHTADNDINNPHIRLHGPGNNDPRIEFGSPTNSGEGGYIMYNDSDEGLYIGSRMATYSEVSICTGMNDGSPTSNVRWSVNANGQVTQPAQPSFAVGKSGNAYQLNSQVMPFDATRHNTGSHFNTGNYRFTAPFAGRYLFTFHSIVNGSVNYGQQHYDIRINNSVSRGMSSHFSNLANNNWDQVSSSYIFELSANDYVQMYSVSNTGWHGNDWQLFCGQLLS